MQRQVVDVHHWMNAHEFAALYALAQAAPGPNLMVVSLVGWRVGGLDLLLLLRVLGFEGDFFLLDGFVNRVAVMEIAGDSADAEHQGCRDENEIVPIHPNSRAGAMIVRRNFAANDFARMKERFYRREFQKQRRKT